MSVTQHKFLIDIKIKNPIISLKDGMQMDGQDDNDNDTISSNCVLDIKRFTQNGWDVP